MFKIQFDRFFNFRRYSVLYLILSLIYTSCKMEACRDASEMKFTINGVNYPDIDDPASDSIYYHDSGDILLEAKTNGYWFLGDSLLSHEISSKYALKLDQPGSHYIGFGSDPEFPVIINKLEITQPQMDTAAPTDNLAQLIEEISTTEDPEPPAITSPPVSKISEEERLKRKEQARLKKEAEEEKRRQDELIRQQEEKKRQDEINRELDKRNAKAAAEAEYKRLVRNLNKKQRLMELRDMDCLEKNAKQIASGELTLSALKNLKLKGVSVFASGPGRVRFSLNGPNGESFEVLKYVNSGRSDVLFSEWSSVVIREGDTWSLKFKDDQIKLFLSDKCVKSGNQDLNCTGSAFIFNLDYLTE